MLYTIKGLPNRWAFAPPLVVAWIKQLRIEGQKIGNKIFFTREAIREGLCKLHVPHVADFIEKETKENEDLEFNENDCEA